MTGTLRLLGMLGVLGTMPGPGLGQLRGCGKTSLTFLATEQPPGPASLGEFPSMCTIFTELKGKRVFLGGASLIADNQVVTLATLAVRLTDRVEGEEDPNFDLRGAEECGDNQLVARNVYVYCGNTNIQSGDQELTQTRNVSRILTHPEYDSGRLTNDLAILLLDQPFDITESVAPVCVPRPKDENKFAGNGNKCIALGHGADSAKQDGYFSPLLNQVALPMLEDKDCVKSLNDLHFEKNHGFTWNIHPSFLCAGGEAKRDTCPGDGGGPLLCAKEPLVDEVFDEVFQKQGDLKLVQAGITAWGIKCGQPDYPGVYSDLASAACWMDQVMSCFPSSEFNDLINLRADGNRPRSVNGLTDSECRAWQESSGPDQTACGCRQRLDADAEVALDADAGDFDIRQA